MDIQFFIGLFAGSLLTFGYVARLLARHYHPIIRAHRALIMDYKGRKDDHGTD